MSTPPLPERWYHIGPHGFFDLVRLARRGRSSVVRALYVLALFAALAIVYHNEPEPYQSGFWIRPPSQRELLEENANRNARIAERFSYTILLGQNIAILLLMPIYVAGSVLEERDNRTLGLLFTTQLSARAIVLGKLVSRMVHVGSVLLGGLPILALVTLWGGVDMPVIACNFWNAGLWLFSVGSFSLLVAVNAQTLTQSLLTTYASFGALLICCCTPMAFNEGHLFLMRPMRFEIVPFHPDTGYEWMYAMTGFATLLHVVVGVWYLRRAIAGMELLRSEEPVKADPAARAAAYPLQGSPPPVTDDALVWKERLFERTFMHVLPLIVMPFVLCVCIVFAAVWAANSGFQLRRFESENHGVFIWMILGSSGVFLALVTARIAGCIVRERQQQTLDALLTLPLSAAELLHAKVVGNLLRFWTWLVPFGLAWLTLMLVGSGPRIAGVVLLVVLAIHLYFFASLALYLSVITRTSTAAFVSLAIAAAVILVGTAIVPGALMDWRSSSHALNPIACWVSVTNDWWRFGHAVNGGEILASCAFYLVAAMFLHQLAVRRFERREE